MMIPRRYFLHIARLFIIAGFLLATRSLQAGIIITVLGSVADTFTIKSVTGHDLGAVTLSSNYDGSFSCTINHSKTSSWGAHATQGTVPQTVLLSLLRQLDREAMPRALEQSDVAAALTLLWMTQNSNMPPLSETLQVGVQHQNGGLVIELSNSGATGTLTLTLPDEGRDYGHVMVTLASGNFGNVSTFFISYDHTNRPIVTAKRLNRNRDNQDDQDDHKKTETKWWQCLFCFRSSERPGSIANGRCISENYRMKETTGTTALLLHSLALLSIYK